MRVALEGVKDTVLGLEVVEGNGHVKRFEVLINACADRLVSGQLEVVERVSVHDRGLLRVQARDTL